MKYRAHNLETLLATSAAAIAGHFVAVLTAGASGTVALQPRPRGNP